MMDEHSQRPIDSERIALGIQQPWAELILRGIKTVEIRSRPTRQRGTVYVYASRRPSTLDAASAAARRFGIEVETLPKGVIVGTVTIVAARACRSGDQRAGCVTKSLLRDGFAWELVDARRLATPLAARYSPYGVWFYPFRQRQRRDADGSR